MKSYQNYLFDLYGTLADIHTDEDSASFWRGVSRLLGMQGAAGSPEYWKKRYREKIARLEAEAKAGLPEGAHPEIDLAIVFREFIAEAGAAADERTVTDFARSFRVLSLKKLRLFPGVLRMLDALRASGKRVYLLSNAQALFTRPELRLLGLESRFDGSLLSSEAGRKKPDAAFYRMLLERYDLDPAVTAMVGNDALCDCHGAAAAGLDSFYVRTAQSPRDEIPLPENCIRLEKIADLARYALQPDGRT